MSRSSRATIHRYFVCARRVLVDKQLLSASVVAGLYCNYQYCDDKFPLQPEKHLLAITRSRKVPSSGFNERSIYQALRRLKKKVDILVSLILRSIYLMLAFGPALLTSGLLLSDSDDIKGWWWAFFRNSIRKSGPCSTKFAQWIATRPDLFPMLLCKNLEDLQSKALSHSWRDTEDALLLAFGGSWKESLHIEGKGIRGSNSFSPAVLGSGCVAQVLLGTLEGRQVAVKIIHPGV